jgi:DNA (cytosine-5)-methyltransferase 1
VLIRGLPYTRNRNLRGALEAKINEVSQVLEVDSDDKRPAEEQAQVEVSPPQILRERVLNKTNFEYPHKRYGGDDEKWVARTPKQREEQGPLTCRWKSSARYRDARDRRDHNKFGDMGIHTRIRQAEADEGFRECDKTLRLRFRGKTVRGGSYKPTPPGREQRYIFADIFCGAGGTSHGAVMADLKVSVCANLDRSSGQVCLTC